MEYYIELALRIFASTVVGAIVGYEREIKNKPAGFYTFILVCVGSCIIAILQQNIALDTLEMIKANPELASILKVDQGRIIAQVVSGIGFLGAGTIIHNRSNVKGITTAALLWLVASLGLVIGTGGALNYFVAGVTVIVVLPISFCARKFSLRLAQNRKVHKIRVVFDDLKEKEFYDVLSQLAITVKKIYLLNKQTINGESLKEIFVYIAMPKKSSFEEIINDISNYEFVKEIEEA